MPLRGPSMTRIIQQCAKPHTYRLCKGPIFLAEGMPGDTLLVTIVPGNAVCVHETDPSRYIEARPQLAQLYNSDMLFEAPGKGKRHREEWGGGGVQKATSDSRPLMGDSIEGCACLQTATFRGFAWGAAPILAAWGQPSIMVSMARVMGLVTHSASLPSFSLPRLSCSFWACKRHISRSASVTLGLLPLAGVAVLQTKSWIQELGFGGPTRSWLESTLEVHTATLS